MYEGVAKFYDRYTTDLNHKKVADFAEKCFSRYGNKGIASVRSKRKKALANEFPDSDEKTVNGADVENSTLVLDCACGTGALTCILAERGYDMTGLDISQEMLFSAMESAEQKNLDILWLCQDMCKMNMYGSFAALLCMTDGVNHIMNRKRLDAFFSRIYNFIDKGGLLIFDFLTDKYFEKRVGNNVFFEDGEDGSCLWTSRYNAKSLICTYNVIVYEQCADEKDSLCGEPLFSRSDDCIREKAWTFDEMAASVVSAGFEICCTCADTSFTCADSDSERVYIVAKK